MSEIYSSNDEEMKTIVNIKKGKVKKSKLEELKTEGAKPLKKELSDDAKLVRANNAKKALEARMSKFYERQKLKKVEHNIKNIFDDDDDNEEEEPVIVIKSKKNENEGAKNRGGETQNNNDLLNILNKMSSRVDKLYTMKKMKNNQPKKEIQPVIINDNTKSTSLLESIRNKMINQY
jgi:hypothetical protein